MKKLIQKYPLIALVGRTNVGKSTLFNKLTDDKVAIVSNIPGTTRDKRYGNCLWLGQTTTLIDTAGLDVESDHAIDLESIKQAKQAVKEAVCVFFVVDGKAGVLPQDKDYAKLLKKMGAKVIVVVNKIDSQRLMQNVSEFYELGFKDIFAVSSKTGAGTGDLLDFAYSKIDFDKIEEIEINDTEQKIKIAIIGKPNVGKSSLINKIVGSEKAIVSEVPHTTRDSQDLTFKYTDKNQKAHILTFIDTAGIIKQRKIIDRLQQASIDQSVASLKKSDVVLLVIDANEEITMQDKHLANEILENNKSLIFVVNKWDLLKDKDTHSDKAYTNFLYKSFPYLTWGPVIFTSAKTGAKVDRVIETAIEIYENSIKKISNEELIEFKHYIVKKQSPRKSKGTKRPFIDTIRQIHTAPQTFEIVGDTVDNLHFSYLRFIQNRLREKFNLIGCGIKLVTSERIKKRKHVTTPV